MRIATAGSGGNFYRLGGGLASILNDEIDGIQATIQATGGTVENLDLLADREVEIAYVTGSVALQAFENEGVFADRPAGRYEGLRAIATVYPNPQWFVVIDDSIQSIHDLKGKRVSVGMQGSNGEAWWRQIMEHLGWTYADIQAEYTVHQATIDQVRNRQIDAIVWPDAPGSASIQEIVDTGFGKVLSVDEDIIQYMADQGGLPAPAGDGAAADSYRADAVPGLPDLPHGQEPARPPAHHPRRGAGRHRRPLRLLRRVQLYRHRHARRLLDLGFVDILD